MKTTRPPVCLCVFLFASTLRADVGVFTGTGQNLQQVSTESVRLVSIDVTIMPQRGPHLFDGGVAGMDQVEYRCRFELRNLTDEDCALQVGFPIDSDLDRVLPETKSHSLEWVLTYGFIARDENTTYNVDFQRLLGKKAAGQPKAIFTWTMSFRANETKTLFVQYRIPMAMTLASTSKRGWTAEPEDPAKPWMELLNYCSLQIAGYTTETGSSWSGNVEKATFTVITAPFERYLNHRGFLETTPEHLEPDKPDNSKNVWPVQHVWWYRDIKPDGWRPVEEGIRWEYKDFKPKDPITLHYYLLQVPRSPDEVDPWIDALLEDTPDRLKKPDDLALMRQVLLATYGREPKDQAAREFVEDQIWYHPKKDFSPSNLTKEQQAVLQELDRRLESIRSGKEPLPLTPRTP